MIYCLYMHDQFTPRRFGSADNYHVHLCEAIHLAVMPFAQPHASFCIPHLRSKLARYVQNPLAFTDTEMNTLSIPGVPYLQSLFVVRAPEYWLRRSARE